MVMRSDPVTDTQIAMHERYFAPVVLAPFADELARRLSRLNHGPLLEIAADGGVLTQSLADAVSIAITIIATDPDQASVDFAVLRTGIGRVAWRRADPTALPWKDSTFGIVTTLFGVPLAENRLAMICEARRVLAPVGRFVFCLAGELEHNPVAACIQETLNILFPANPPEYLVRRLHGSANFEAVDDDLTAAGFTDAIYALLDLPLAAASARDIALGYLLGTPIRQEIEQRTNGDTAPVLDTVITALEHRFGTGPIKASMRGHVVSAAG